MSKKIKVQRTASAIQHYALTNTLNQVVKLVNDNFEATTLTNIEANSYYDASLRSHINCTLMHIKKKINESYKFSKNKNAATRQESTYFRFLVLADNEGNPLCLIVENDSSKGNVLGHFESMSIGNQLKIVSPSFKGYFNQMPILACELLLPLSSKPAFQKNIVMSGMLGEDYVMARIITKNYVVKQVGIADHCCKGFCDSRYGNNCYCKNKIGLTGSVLSFTIALKDLQHLKIKSFISHKLTKLLVEEEVIINLFAKDGVSCLFEIETHIIDHFKDKELAFLLWCKPYKDEENDSFAISKGNVTDVEVVNEATFEKWKFPVATVSSTGGGRGGDEQKVDS